jgi:hypothetical protein
MSDNKKNNKEQTTIASFFQPVPKLNNDGSFTVKILPTSAVKTIPHHASHACKAPKCMRTFKTTQGLASHHNACHYYKMLLRQQEPKNTLVLCQDSLAISNKARKSSSKVFNNNIATTLEINNNDDRTDNIQNEEKVDKRVNNRGAAFRQLYSNSDKWKIIEDFESWLSENPDGNVQQYIKQFRLPAKFKDFLSKSRKGWRYPETKEAIFNNTKMDIIKKLKVPLRSRLYAPKYPLMENALKNAIIDRRARKAKVSSAWIKMKARLLFKEKYAHIDPDQFKASNGWFLRFLRRHRIKFRKRKNLKATNAEDKREKIMEWHRSLRYNVLPYRQGHIGSYHPYYGRFPPERRYNMDQIPMPFVIDQDSTFTTSDDEHVHVHAHHH